jgi:hypothetical protein
MSTGNLFEQTPSALDVPPLATATNEPSGDEKRAARLARDFVRWCYSFGAEFRNSPDIANLRYWVQKSKLKIKEREEAEVLEIARPIFFKRLEQVTQKSASN